MKLDLGWLGKHSNGYCAAVDTAVFFSFGDALEAVAAWFVFEGLPSLITDYSEGNEPRTLFEKLDAKDPSVRHVACR
jgi:hypothetical protein